MAGALMGVRPPGGADHLARGRALVGPGDQRTLGRRQAMLGKGPGAFSPDEDVVTWLKYMADVGRGFEPGTGFRSVRRRS